MHTRSAIASGPIIDEAASLCNILLYLNIGPAENDGKNDAHKACSFRSRRRELPWNTATRWMHCEIV
ncbi:hypothetical protein ACFS07_02160 [Undibacterium arcticum]